MPFPLIPLITAAMSLGSAAVAKRKAKQAEKEAETMLGGAPKYRPNQSILNYYDEALRRYNVAPTDTSQYKMDKQNIKQGTVQGLSSLNKLRSGDVSNLIQGQNTSLLRAAANAENRKAQEFNVLGQAAGIKAGQEAKAFQQNELYPFEGKYNLMTMKAAGERASQRQATKNLYDNLLAAQLSEGEEGKTGEGLKNAVNNSWLTGIFGNKGQRSQYRWEKGGKKWWQN